MTVAELRAKLEDLSGDLPVVVICVDNGLSQAPLVLPHGALRHGRHGLTMAKLDDAVRAPGGAERSEVLMLVANGANPDARIIAVPCAESDIGVTFDIGKW